MTTLPNRPNGRLDELALIQSEPISTQWINELWRKLRPSGSKDLETTLMFTTDSLLISTSYGEVQRALVNVGSTILQTLFKDALKAFRKLGFKNGV